MLAPGTLIKNYEIQRKLGRGGMGAVFVAHDQVLGRMVAIKLCQKDLDLPDAAERFTREARSAAALQHANIVTVHEFFAHESQAYIAMEYVQGETLAAIIQRREPVALADKLRWLHELCAAVAYAHSFKVVHRDLKPANLMIDRTGRLRVLDFGIAKILGAPSTTATGPIGTPGYMAPEQILDGQVDHRADIFAIGVVAYQLLSYTEAFAGQNPVAIIEKVKSKDPPPLAGLVPNAPQELIVAVERALKKAPAERFGGASELAAIIERVRREVESEVVTKLPPRPPTAGEKPPTGTGKPWTDVGAGMPTPSAPLPGRDPEGLRVRRTAMIEAALDRSRAALQRGELEIARDECDQALMLDATNAPAIALDVEIEGAAANRRAATLRDEARQKLSQGSLTGAQHLLAQARELDPSAADLRSLDRDLLMARVEQERVRHRTESARLAVERAEDALKRSDLASALAFARQALDLDPADPRARSVEALALRALDEDAGSPTVFAPAVADATAPTVVDATIAMSTGSTVVDPPTVVLPAGGSAPAPSPAPGKALSLPSPPAPVAKAMGRTPVATPPRRSLKDAIPLAKYEAVLGRSAASLRTSADPAMAAWRKLPASQKKIAAGVTAGVLLLGVIVAVIALRPTPVPPTFVADIDAVPYATVTQVQRADGTLVELPPEPSTPLSLTLPAGTYRVQLTGPAPDNETRDVTMDVRADGTVSSPIEKFRTLTPAEYFEQYLSAGSETPATEVAPDGSPLVPAPPAPPAQGVSQ